MTKTVITIVGARPQFVKAAALSPALRKHVGLREVIVHTGQHFDVAMSDVFFREMNLPDPWVNLGIGGGTHGQNTGRMIEAIERVLIDVKPACVVVFGDTDSTLAAAIATSKTPILLAHIEAGLRSFRRDMPEEINRTITDHVSDVLYVPSKSAMRNLVNEGIRADKLVECGDIMYDCIKSFSKIAGARSTIVAQLNMVPGNYHVLTMHRKENIDNKDALYRVMEALSVSAVPIVFPLHPRTAKRLHDLGLSLPPTVTAIKPQGYLDMLQLLSNCDLVMTDSGGVQKEAYFLGKRCITLRDETEWVELVDIGANVLTGCDSNLIAAAITSKPASPPAEGVYGDGSAAIAIANDLAARLL